MLTGTRSRRQLGGRPVEAGVAGAGQGGSGLRVAVLGTLSTQAIAGSRLVEAHLTRCRRGRGTGGGGNNNRCAGGLSEWWQKSMNQSKTAHLGFQNCADTPHPHFTPPRPTPTPQFYV